VDGIKVFLDRSEWVLILPDAEEPLFHVYAEAGDDERAKELAEGYLETLRAVLGESKPS
jgi:mannose-1-phosphate guanylyltransferase/phosphomannomutase